MQSPSNASDEQLVRRSAAGDARAFGELFDRHGDRLFRLARATLPTPADAEDVLQETLAGAYRGLSRFEARASVKTWLTRILITQVAKWRRDRAGRRAEAIGDREVASADRATSSVAAKLDVQAAIRRLSDEHREVLLLREWEQMSYDEIAQSIGVPRGTVESRLFRARAELKKLLVAYSE